jgi:hypothetical protein
MIHFEVVLFSVISLASSLSRIEPSFRPDLFLIIIQSPSGYQLQKYFSMSHVFYGGRQRHDCFFKYCAGPSPLRAFSKAPQLNNFPEQKQFPGVV